jgi:hypothetical protein
MLSVRNAILISLFVCVASLVAGVVSLLGTPDSHGAAIDSYGTRRDGFRAAFELLSAFKVPVERRIEPPSRELSTSSTLVLCMPHDDLISNEPVYLERLLSWVEGGGRLVVAMPPAGRTSEFSVKCNSESCNLPNIWTTLKLDDVRSTPIELSNNDDEDDASSDDDLKPPSEVDQRRNRRQRIQRALEKELGMHPIEYATVSALVSGRFENLRDRVRQLQIPKAQIGRLAIDSNVNIAGKIEGQRPDGKPWTLAAAFQRGQGEIVVVAEPMLLMNSSIGQGDNAVLTYDLLAGDGRGVVFDEFYHGLSVRGNPLWLLTKSTYFIVFLATLCLLGLVIWRRAILLGPPLDAASKSRRSIIEYIEAMSRFLNQGRKSHLFLLNEIREGTMRAVGERFGLSPAVRDPEVIAASMAKRSELEANQFRQAMRSLDAALAKGKSLSESEAVGVLQRISRCL